MPVWAMWGLTPFCVALGKSLRLWVLVALCNPADVHVGIVATQIKSRGVQVLWQEGKATRQGTGSWQAGSKAQQGCGGLAHQHLGAGARCCSLRWLDLALRGAEVGGGLASAEQLRPRCC